MTYRPEILSFLSTPFSWAIAELLAFGLFFYVLADIMKRNDDKVRIFRVFELIGFVIYAGIFENIGVLGNTYNYSFDRLVMVGTVPLSILMFEAIIFYSALRFAERMKFPKWTIPVVVAFLAVLSDMTIDPVAVYDHHLVNGVMEGRWNWTPHYKNMFFGIPFFNYTGWFFLMFYYTSLIQLGRHLFKKSDYKIGRGIAYVTIAPILGVLLIISPLTRFFLYLSPIYPVFLNRGAEILMLSIVMISSIIILIKHWKRDAKISFKDEPVIWIIPLILHTFDIVLAFSLKISIAYVPVLLFAGIHLGYLGFYYLRSRKMLNDEINFAIKNKK